MFVAPPRRKRGSKSRAQVTVKFVVKKVPDNAPPRPPHSDQHLSVLQNKACARLPPRTAAPSPHGIPDRLPGPQLLPTPRCPNAIHQSAASIPQETRKHQDGKQYSHDISQSQAKSPQNSAVGMIDKRPEYGMERLDSGSTICDLISSKFDSVITSIDGEIFSGDERELSEFRVKKALRIILC